MEGGKVEKMRRNKGLIGGVVKWVWWRMVWIITEFYIRSGEGVWEGYKGV